MCRTTMSRRKRRTRTTSCASAAASSSFSCLLRFCCGYLAWQPFPLAGPPSASLVAQASLPPRPWPETAQLRQPSHPYPSDHPRPSRQKRCVAVSLRAHDCPTHLLCPRRRVRFACHPNRRYHRRHYRAGLATADFREPNALAHGARVPHGLRGRPAVDVRRGLDVRRGRHYLWNPANDGTCANRAAE